MQLTHEIGRMDVEFETVKWSSETNWVVPHGSIGDIITVESSDCPIDESELPPKLPLVLRPRPTDSSSCEIKISFEQKYDIRQVYMRSTARTYEVYYATAPNGSNEYLCTVRCCVAERDGNLLQATSIEDVSRGTGDCLLGELTEETVSDGGSAATSEDGWVRIKSPEVGRSLPKVVKTGGMKDTQDLYEAAAQISDVEPCCSLTIRLVSLQDKSCACVDELYIFLDPVELPDSGNDAVLPGTSTQNSLLAMFLPSLLQLSKSGSSRVGDKSDYNEASKDSKVETGSSGIDESNVGLDKNQVHQLSANLEELDKRKRRIDEINVGLEAKSDQHQHAKSKEPEKDTDESEVLVQPTQMQVPTELIQDGNLPIKMLEQLISRVSQVEDICNRFEEKMLKPIQSIEARLQQVENQLEKLAQSPPRSSLPQGTRFSAPPFPCSEPNSSSFDNEQAADGASEHDTKEALCDDHSSFPHGTRFFAPAFSCSESNSSSFYNEQTADGQPCGPLEHEKKESLYDNDKPELSRGANLRPSLIIRAPEFSYSEDEDDLKPSNCSPVIEQNKKLSIDDALAAAFHGFSFSTISQTTSGLPSKPDEENRELGEPCQIEVQEKHGAGDDHGETPGNAHDCTADEIGDKVCTNDTQLSSDVAFSLIENKEKDKGDELAPSSNQNQGSVKSGDVSDFVSTQSTHIIDSTSNESGAHDGNGHHINESSLQGNIGCDPLEMGNDSIKNSMEKDSHPIYDKDAAASEEVFGSESASDATLLDLEFPVLEVKFVRDACASFKSPIEALLDGAADPSSEANKATHLLVDTGASSADVATNLEGISGNPSPSTHPVHGFTTVDSNKETTDLLVDIGDSSADVATNLEGISGHLSSPGTLEMNVSLI